MWFLVNETKLYQFSFKCCDLKTVLKGLKGNAVLVFLEQLIPCILKLNIVYYT